MSILIRWFLRNRVAANLAMVALVFAGISALLSLTVRTFPEINTGVVRVTVAYPGATPAEVAGSILVPIEEQITGLAGIRSLDASASRGLGTVTVQLTRAADTRSVTDDIDTAVSRITTFPDAAETPRVTEVEPTEVAVELALYGTTDRGTLKALAEIVRDDLTAMDPISQVTVQGIAGDQIEIAVSRATLEAYGISLTDLGNRIDAASIDLAGGEIDTGASTIQVRVSAEADTADALRDIVMFTGDNGAQVRLGDIATVRDGLSENARLARIDGSPAIFLSVERTGTEQVLAITDAVAQYHETTLQDRLPPGIESVIWRNNGAQLQGRIDLLAKNGAIGAALILLVLALFLDLRVAAWVAAGVAIAFIGAFLLMQILGVAISQLSLFGFILALGIVVDDAIVVGENTYSELESGEPDGAAERGVLRVWRPILFSVTTTILAFTPLLLVPGASGSFIGPVAAVVIFVLALSLFESFFILPRHLLHIRLTEPRRFSPRRLTDPLRAGVDRGFRRFSEGPLARLVRFSIAHPAVIIAGCLASLLLTMGMIQGGKVRFEFFPQIEGNFVSAELRMPDGTSEAATLARAEDIAEAAWQAADTLGADVLERTGVTIGFSTGGGPGAGGDAMTGSTATISAQLKDAETREIAAAAFTDAWREAVGRVPGARELLFSASLVGVGAPIALEISAETDRAREEAVAAIRQALSERQGVRDIRDNGASTAMDLVLIPRADAASFGVSQTAIAREVRAAFYGVTIDQIARDREEVDIRLRLTETDRGSVADLRRLTVPGPEGAIPLTRLVWIEERAAATTINRAEGRTVTTVTAEVDTTQTTGGAETAHVLSEVVPALRDELPGLAVNTGGEQEEAGRFSASLAQNFSLALFGIYAVLALAFGSYLRPLIVLLVLPFGFVGAVLAHAALGLNLTLLSMFGIIGLSGVIVNGALLIVDYIMAAEEEGASPEEAIASATLSRFRPITLTTLTTFLGVTPLILETSVQAQFLIPTAVSLGFGVLFASVLQMLLVPAYASVHAKLRRSGPARRASSA